MDRLQVHASDRGSVKARALEDARQMQSAVTAAANKAGKTPPKYVLDELIGKGSFGRVYRGKDMTTAEIVAVKIIDIDKSDTASPRNADSFNETLNEINALKKLSMNRARNINHVIEALLVDQSIWMITEYCGGGSVGTLMKPTFPGGLQEKWIIPILREVAEAIRWVHQAGIIHRDIKSGNVLVTEQGSVQLCDFGVAGTIETKLDKRSTFIGTLHWMAPELFDPSPSYSKEVDIWAFGSMAYEIATGLPPNVSNAIAYDRLGTHLKSNPPRLEGGNYSDELRSLISYCLEELPSARPDIEMVQRHPYIFNTYSQFPTSTLSHLVRAFRLWEDHGGSRRSLFMVSGAQGNLELSPTSLSDNEWNFSTTAAFDHSLSQDSSARDVYDAYGENVQLDSSFAPEPTLPELSQQGRSSRRRPPPKALVHLPAPLEKIFDPNTLSNYNDNSKTHYNQQNQQLTSDLPLRNDSAHTSIRDTMLDLGEYGHTMIDLGEYDSDLGGSNSLDFETMKPDRSYSSSLTEDEDTLSGSTRSTRSDSDDTASNRLTKDWKFPTMSPPTTPDSTSTTSYDLPEFSMKPRSGGRPALIHRATEPYSAGVEASPMRVHSVSDLSSMRESLIDLDMSMPDSFASFTESSNASSDAESTTSEETYSNNLFELERHVSLRQSNLTERTPSIYTTDEIDSTTSTPASEEVENPLGSYNDYEVDNPKVVVDSDSEYTKVDLVLSQTIKRQPPGEPYDVAPLFTILQPPSVAALSGNLSDAEMAAELKRLIGGMAGQLRAFRSIYTASSVSVGEYQVICKE